MSEILVNLSRSGWVGGAGLRLRGSLALDDRLASAAEVSRHAEGRLSADLLSRLSGTFALAAQSGPVVQAATDRIRSIPLYYATTTERGYLTDDPYWLLEQLPEEPRIRRLVRSSSSPDMSPARTRSHRRSSRSRRESS